MSNESTNAMQDVQVQGNAPSLEEEVRSHLEHMQPLRPTVERIDPETAAVVTFGEVLEEAIAHYASFEPPLKRMPDFLLVDWEGDDTSPWAALAEKHQVCVLPLSQRDSLSQPHLCAYARHGEVLWCPYGYYKLFYSMREKGIDTFQVDSSLFRGIWRRPAYAEYISARWCDITKIYSVLADEDSKESYLRAIKALITGSCDYLRVAPYPQYQHPIVGMQPGDVVIEGGLETGDTTLTIAQQVAPHGRVIGFEPVQQFAENSRAKVKDFPNAHIEQLGLWSGESTFYIENKQGASRLVDTPSSAAEECHTTDIDTYIAQHKGFCSCIKLDIEGAEIECLKGAMRTLHHYRPKLMISLYHDKSHYIDIPLMLMEANLGYTFYVGHHDPHLTETVLYALPSEEFCKSDLQMESTDTTQNIQIQSIVPSLEEEVRSRLARMQPLRPTVERIDPETTAVVTFGEVLGEAIAHYASFEPPLKRMPDFLLVDWEGDDTSPWSALAEKHQVRVLPLSQRDSLPQPNLCAFARSLRDFWLPGGYLPLVECLDAVGIKHFYVDANFHTHQPRHTPQKDYVEERMGDICKIYASLADEISKDIYLRNIKTLATGEPGYQRVSTYQQYMHPLVSPESGDVVIEGGLDTDTTQRMAELVGPQGRVFGFEPVSAAAERVRNSVKNCSNVVVEQLGLWSGSCVFYIEDFGGGSRMVASPNERTEECHSIDIDTYIAQHKERCSCIKLDIEGAEIECLKGAMRTLHHYRPKLMISLYHDKSHYIDIPLMLLEENLDYTFYVGQHQPYYYETILYALPSEEYLVKDTPCIQESMKGTISVVISAYNCSATLERCLDSVLVQQGAALDIIVVDDASTDATPEILARYASQYPEIVRTLRFSQNKGAGAARNAGLDMARGEYITFVDSDDMLAENILKNESHSLWEQRPDILAFDILLIKGWGEERECRWNVVPGIFDGVDSLEHILLKRGGSYATHSKFFQKDFLRQYNIRFSNALVHEDLHFIVQAFYHSHKTIILPSVGYFCYKSSNGLASASASERYFDAFSFFVVFFIRFFEAHNLNVNSPGAVYCLRTLYGWDRSRLLATVSDAIKKGNVNALLTPQRLADIASSKEVLSLFLTDCALLHCHTLNLVPLFQQNSIDCQVVKSPTLLENTCIAYGNADVEDSHIPLLSVIVPNYNKFPYIERCLESVLTQSMQDFELIIVDDASTDGSYEKLQDYADKHTRIRLFRMKYNCRQGECRNIGMGKARAQYVVFVDSDDICLQEYFEAAQEIVNNTQPDLIVFKTPFKVGPEIFGSSVCDASDAENAYWVGLFDSAPWAKVYKKSIIDEYNIAFPENVYHQDQPFVLNFIRKSKICNFDERVVYEQMDSADSSTRPQKFTYLHIHSSCVFIDFLKRAWESSIFYEGKKFSANGICHNSQNILLPAICACYKASGTIGMADSDFACLQHNEYFLRFLLTTFAELHEATHVRETICVTFPKRLSESSMHWPEVEQPLLTVIVPVYNQEKYLARCLDSILFQSLRCIEVLVVNDASTDCTAQICEEYAAKDGRIKILTNLQNRGQGISRNIALEQAKGQFITYVDSDDCLAPDVLLPGLRMLLDANTIDIVHFNCSWIDKNGRETRKDIMPVGIFDGEKLFYEYCMGKVRSWAVWGKIYRADFLKKYNIQFSEYLHEDNLFLLEAYFYARNMLFCGKDGYIKYEVVHETSAMNPAAIKPHHVLSFYYLMEGIEKFFQEHPDIPQSVMLCEKRLSSLFHIYYKFTSYILMFNMHPNIILTNTVLESVASSPTFLRMLFEHSAELYARSTGFKAQLPSQDMDPLHVERAPATELVPYVFHPHPCEDALVSVIVPAWNVEPTLAKCLDSILAQDLKRVEILLVEDCSNRDSTLALCEEYARKYPQIRLFQTRWNSGLGVVRNLAVREARGEYITFVDSDDWMEPYFLRRGTESFDECPEASIVATNVNQFFENENVLTTFPNAIVSSEIMLQYYVSGKFKHWGAWSILYKKSFLQDNNIECGEKYNEDEIFLLKVYALAGTVCLRSFIGYNHMRYGESESIMRPRVRGKKYFDATLYNLRNVHDFLAQLPGAGENSKVYEQRMESFRWNHHRDNLLQYIFSCKELGLPSPLTKGVLQTLCCSKVFLRNMLMEHAQLIHAPQVHASKPTASMLGKVSPVRPYVQPTAAQAKIYLGMGSLFERLLWRISPKRACIKALRRSKMFDADYYRQTNPDVAQSGVDPVYHYVHFGAAEGRNPTPWFNTYNYIAKNPDVAASGANAFYHYLRYGHLEGRQACGWNAVMSVEEMPALDMGPLFERALWHVAPKRACIQALRRSGLVDANYYRQANPDVAQTGVDPAYHYVHFGAAEGRNPAPWFDTLSYVGNNPDVAASGANAFYHFLRYGHKEGRRPN